MWARYGLTRKRLDVLDGMFGRIVQELTNDLNAFIVGNMDSRLIAVGLSMEVLLPQNGSTLAGVRIHLFELGLEAWTRGDCDPHD